MRSRQTAQISVWSLVVITGMVKLLIWVVRDFGQAEILRRLCFWYFVVLSSKLDLELLLKNGVSVVLSVLSPENFEAIISIVKQGLMMNPITS